MKIQVAVFFGGRSVEHEISVISALQAIHAFDTEKYAVTPVYISKQGKWYSGDALLQVENYKNIPALLAKCDQVYFMPGYGNNKLYRAKKGLFGSAVVATIDVVCPVLHGTNGEDGSFQGVIEMTGLPYVGCNVLASANGMDKITMKMILKESGVPVVDYVWFTDKQWRTQREEMIAQVEHSLGYPVIVKPGNLGSSVGISHADDRQGLIQAVDEAAHFSTRLIVEKMVEDLQEINCAVMGDPDENETTVCEEPIRSGEILSYEDKYMGGSKSSKGMQSTQRRIPADLAPEVTARIRQLTSETFRVLSCSGVARVDFMIDRKSGAVYVNEINTIPGSLSFYLWEASGLKFDQLMDRLISIALKRRRELELKTVSYDQNIFNLGKGFKGGKMGVK